MAYPRVVAAVLGNRALEAAMVGLLLWGVGTRAASAGDEPIPHAEMWTGGEAFQQVWSVYGGMTWAPFGGIQQDGVRARAILGYGDYRSGAVAFGDLLLGYHKQLGPLTIKVFAGLAIADHHPIELTSALEGTDIGAKGVLEAWWNIGEQVWASADLSGTSLDMDYGSRLRLGWRVRPELSAGLEGGSTGTWERDIARLGGFLRYEWGSGEVSMSGGWAAGGTWSDREPAAPFATVSVLTRF